MAKAQKPILKWLIPGIVFIFLVGGVYFFNPKNTGLLGVGVNILTGNISTVNWKTYSSSLAGFSLKYPVTWSLNYESSSPYVEQKTFRSWDYSESIKFPSGIVVKSGYSLSVRNTLANHGWKDYQDLKNSRLASGIQRFDQNRKEIIVDGENCLLAENYKWEDGWYTAICSMFHNGIAIDIILHKKQSETKTFKDILSTFEFTNSAK